MWYVPAGGMLPDGIQLGGGPQSRVRYFINMHMSTLYIIYGILTVYTMMILLGSLAVAEELVQLVAAPTR